MRSIQRTKVMLYFNGCIMCLKTNNTLKLLTIMPQRFSVRSYQAIVSQAQNITATFRNIWRIKTLIIHIQKKIAFNNLIPLPPPAFSHRPPPKADKHWAHYFIPLSLKPQRTPQGFVIQYGFVQQSFLFLH